MGTMTITLRQLEVAVRQWVIENRSGQNLSDEETVALSIEHVAAESAAHLLWYLRETAPRFGGPVLRVSLAHVRGVMLGWEKSRRAGLCLAADRVAARPADQVAAEMAAYLWECFSIAAGPAADQPEVVPQGVMNTQLDQAHQSARSALEASIIFESYFTAEDGVVGANGGMYERGLEPRALSTVTFCVLVTACGAHATGICEDRFRAACAVQTFSPEDARRRARESALCVLAARVPEQSQRYGNPADHQHYLSHPSWIRAHLMNVCINDKATGLQGVGFTLADGNDIRLVLDAESVKVLRESLREGYWDELNDKSAAPQAGSVGDPVPVQPVVADAQ